MTISTITPSGRLPLKVNLLALDYGDLERLAAKEDRTAAEIVEELVIAYLSEGGAPARRLPMRLTPEQFADIVQLWTAGAEISHIVTVSGLPDRSVREGVAAITRTYDQIASWHRLGLRATKIADRLGWPAAAVASIITHAEKR